MATSPGPRGRILGTITVHTRQHQLGVYLYDGQLICRVLYSLVMDEWHYTYPYRDLALEYADPGLVDKLLWWVNLFAGAGRSTNS